MNFFTRDRSFYRTLILLALPIALQQLITFSVSFADNIMVGSLGDLAISGVYMGNQIQTVLQMVLNGIGMAMAILSTQYWGKNDTHSIRTIVAIAFRLALLFGLVLTVVCLLFPTQLLALFTDDLDVVQSGTNYLLILSCSYVFFCISQVLVAAMRSVESPRVGMILSIITLIVNVSLNWIFIFGKFGMPAMGIEGAALGTLISRIVEAGFMVYYVLKVDQKLRLKLRDFLRRNRLLLADYMRYGLPVVAGDAVWAINTLAQSAILGRLSAEAITAASISTMMNNLAYVWITGLCSAIAIITGKTVGAGKFDTMKEYAKTTQVLFLAVGFATGLILFVLRQPFLSLYNISQTSAEIANQMMAVLAITMIGSCYQAACLAGLVKAGGDTSFVFKMDVVFVFFIVLPAGVIALWLGAPAWVVFACLKSDQILKCFVAIVKINSYNWMKNLTRNDTVTVAE